MPTVGVFAALLDEGGRVFLVQRNYGPRNWATPGGRMDPGEDPRAALVREVSEETGYRIAVGPLIGVYSAPWKDDLVLFFLVEQTGRDNWQPGDEIADLRFFARDELPPMRQRTLVGFWMPLTDALGSFESLTVMSDSLPVKCLTQKCP